MGGKKAATGWERNKRVRAYLRAEEQGSTSHAKLPRQHQDHEGGEMLQLSAHPFRLGQASSNESAKRFGQVGCSTTENSPARTNIEPFPSFDQRHNNY
jgi:hypothetical protein